MKRKLLITLFTTLFAAGAAFGQVSWLDRPLSTNWNSVSGIVPAAPRDGEPIEGICRTQIRTPESLSDRAVTRAGWSLFGPAYVYGQVTIVTAMASVDGMCRPNQYNGFVFVGNRFAGTFAPTPSFARTDGALGRIILMEPTEATVEFARYTSNDALCCPSQTSLVTYTIGTGPRAVVKAEDVSTSAICRDGGDMQTQDNVVAGTVAYRQRAALPPTAVLTVSLIDISRQGAPAVTIAEQRIETRGQQQPFNFGFAYDRTKIVERNRYSIRAQITDGERLLFTSDTNHPVITQGNPRNVDIVVVPVGAQTRPDRGAGTIRGTVSYPQRIALGRDSSVTVKLVDSAAPEGESVAETTVLTNGRQVPIPFELNFEPRDINRQRAYELRAEITTDSEVRFRSEAGQPVTIRGNMIDNVQIVVAPAKTEPVVITGQTLSLSKFGTGSIQVEGRSSELLIRGSVNVQNDGSARVTVSSITGSISFDGKLIAFDNNVLRIAVSSSGNADAGGEIEIRYSGRNLNAIIGNSLVLDGQNLALRF